jgi:hypothetical protein
MSRATMGWLGMALVATATTSHGAVILGQVDTFEDGTTQEWSIGSIFGGHPAPPANVPSGGPAGVDDNYLRLTALGGGGAGSRLSVLNRSQWSGDYLAAGVSRIQLDVRNFGPEDVVLRLGFFDPVGGAPTNGAVTDGVPVFAGGEWQRIEFLTTPATMTTLFGDVTALMSNVTEVRLFHNPNPTFPGPGLGPPTVNALVGIDNIRAVPEPGWGVAVAVVGCYWLRRERRRYR